ncbi:DnaJ C-terminal domain-containing protein [Xanthomonas translucens]|uniref:DnaJ C-terminal domain-containing protein n=3 Tax=Xanthomonas campestris pv. translucens TaxID=343 RepID=A0ABW9KZ43_XANCT|nr:DnaJ C-terminal domain-containing protein [Xanthomonas translucens]MCS3361616.1 DnaJ domain-containing protein [Xanthomonas translucens pv. translucens]MCS3373463.1 DnaJ domain-containing protein [Xanthomonas translucens pv. translucens]MCT8274739.1 DnaJ domain-containing protein [Xanthomonas translucens pv. translucens]MCT8279992.1 DnaJ domain-containing protein [Xanthomonas translucens pv. translucens]MCT8291205.1 DnaJ domain-containing protein [Xanthomonas translucens pv. translucens]
MEFKDYYATLGVEPSAGDAEIKTAYRRLARKYHPDVSKEAGAEDKFKAINEAYEALRDPPKRAAYDQLRAQGYRPGEEFQAPPNYGGAQGYDFEEVFGNGGAGGGFSDFFESLFARQQRARQGGAGPGPGPGAGPAPRGDTRAKLAVPLEAVYSGDSVRITINGRQLDVRVPKGVRPGQVIRLSGQGNGGSNLLLEIEYAAHPQFEVDGLNILYTLPVTPWQAALGTSISVPTLGGAVELKIPPESDAGRKLRLRGRGLPGTPAGDQIVELEVLAPAPETEAQRKAYRGLAKAFGEAV